VNLVEQWRGIERRLPADWSEASLTLLVNDANCARAAGLLGPLQPVRSGTMIRLYPSRASAEAVRRLLARLDREKIAGTLHLSSAQEAPHPEAPARHEALAVAWRELEGGLPEDWSDLYCEVEFDSTDYLEPAALRLAPVNPARADGTTFRFRCARRFGYGAAPEMVRRCLERLDEAGITGEVRILRALSDTKPVATQGPVWYVAGKSV
jgi:hypothetical protein